MAALKSIGYFIVSAIGLCVAGGILVFIVSASAFIGMAVLAVAVIAFIAFCIKEYFEGPAESGPMDRDG